MRGWTGILGGSLLLLGSLSIGAEAQAATVPKCAGPAAGGNWPSYGHDSANTRYQPAEDRIGPAQVAALVPAWTATVEGNIQSTPTVAGGCVYVGSHLKGHVIAYNADSGAIVWRHTVDADGGIVGAITIHNGRAFAVASQSGDGISKGPYLRAFNARTGAVLWTSRPLTIRAGTTTNASPSIFSVPDGSGGTRDLLFVGYFGPTGTPEGQGGYAIVDAVSGAVLRRQAVIPPVDQARGYAGAPIWASAVRDSRSGYAFVGTGNPYSEQEHPHTNAILKIDLTRMDSPTFGRIVDAYKGTADTYLRELHLLNDTAVCEATSPRSPLYGVTGLPTGFGRPACGQLDIDFGGSPNVFSVNGRTYVGEYQKSGVYHVADAATMQPVWSSAVGAPCAVCNGGSTAVSPRGVFGVATPEGAAFALDRATGALQWITPNGALLHWYSTSVANGVVYTITLGGFVEAYDEASGAVLLRRPIAQDVQQPAVTISSAGVSIARHTVYVAAGGGADPQSLGFLVAYRLPASAEGQP